MKITTTAGTLKAGDKLGRRVVRYSTFREYGLGFHVYFEGSDTPEPYGRNEPLTVELAAENRGGWRIRYRKTRELWSPNTFDDEQLATDVVTEAIQDGNLGAYDVEVVFLQ